MDKISAHRRNILEELFQTERNYVEKLTRLDRVGPQLPWDWMMTDTSRMALGLLPTSTHRQHHQPPRAEPLLSKVPT